MTSARTITHMLSIILITVLLAACGVGAPGGAAPGDGGPVDDGPIHGEPGDGEPGDGEPGDDAPGAGPPGDEEPGNGDPGDGGPGDDQPGNDGPGDDQPGDEEPGEDGPGDGEPDDDDSPLAAALAIVNSFRAEPRYCGATLHPAAPSLTLDDRLNRAAQAHGDYMAINGDFSHQWLDGTQVDDRIETQGYRWSTVGENIAMGQRSYEQAIHGWLSSPGHCSNIMNPRFVHMGLASATAANGRQYWTQVFAAPR